MSRTNAQIFISGLPGTGKSTLALQLGKQFSLPVFLKDRFKEAMYEAAFPADNYSAMTTEQQSLFGKLSIQSITVALESMATAARTGIYEANFDGDLFSSILTKACRRHAVHPIVAHLTCDREILVSRFEARERSGARHPGHQGFRDVDRVRQALLLGPDRPLASSLGAAFEFDTSDFNAVDFSPLLQEIERAIVVAH